MDVIVLAKYNSTMNATIHPPFMGSTILLSAHTLTPLIFLLFQWKNLTMLISLE